MIKAVATLVVYGFMGTLEIRPLLRRGRKGEALAVGLVTALGFLYTIGLMSGWPLVNPAHVVEVLFRPMAEFFGAL